MKEQIKRSQLRLLKMHYEAGVGHIGGCLSSLDSLIVLFHQILGENDLFILSKGHSVGALYVALWSKGRLSDEQLTQFHQTPTKLAAHPVAGWIKEIPFATGSLGHGFSLANGVAMAKRLKNEPGQIFCLMSDGEWQEGSTWEALTFMGHHQLSNLTVLVDGNRLQGFGSTQDVGSLYPLLDKIDGFHVESLEVDGHDPESLQEVLSERTSQPRIIVMNTTKGHGVSFMENRMEWHYLPLTESLYHQAVAEIESR